MKGRLFQLYLAIAASFGQTIFSILSAWPSYTNIVYQSVETPLSAPMTTSEESLLGSLPSLGAMAGTAVAGWLIDTMGRRNGGVIMALPYVISWIMIAATTSMSVVLVARFLAGVAGGASLVYAPVYISEVAEDNFRGSLASVVTLMYCIGILVSYILGWILTYMQNIYTNLAISSIYTLVMMTLTESPVYLMKRKRFGDARNAIAHYRGCSPSSERVREEFEMLKDQLMLSEVTPETETLLQKDDYERISVESNEMKEKKMSVIKSLFFVRSSRRAFWVVLIVMLTQVFMGIVPVQVYAESVFQQADPDNANLYSVIFALVLTVGILVPAVLMGIVPVQVYAESVFQQADPDNANLYSVIFALVLTVGSLVPAVIADKVGRRVLLISSSILVGVCLTVLALLLQFHAGPPWLSMLVIMLYCFSLMYGASSVPYVLLAEVFVTEVQNLASILIIEWVWFLCFLSIALFPFMLDSLGTHGTFYCFAFVGFANAIYCYYKVPETKGLSIEKIQQIFDE